ncbi:scaffolding protein [Gordonia phage Jifall16]|nr:scaffolding protein [Gordonia phage Jifall16]
MKHITRTRAIAAAMPLDGGLPFAGRPARAGRAIPRRDDNDGHPNPNGGKPKGDKDDDADGGKPDGGKPKGDKDDDDDEPKPVDVKGSPEYKEAERQRRAEKKRADDAEAALEEARRKGMSDDEKIRDDEIKSRVATAVTEKETELTDHYEGQIASLQTQIIDSTIESVFAGGGLDRKDYEDVIATLDKTHFIKDDGSVDREKVKKTLAPLAKAAVSRPPRTSSARRTENKGFGRYLESKD